MPTPTFWRALAADLLFIILFAAIGRRSHDEATAISGVLTTAAPFLIGYTVTAALTRLDRGPLSIAHAVIAWAPGITLGMVLRHSVFDRGTARSFVVVAFVATAVFLIGWRLVALIVRRARRRTATS